MAIDRHGRGGNEVDRPDCINESSQRLEVTCVNGLESVHGVDGKLLQGLLTASSNRTRPPSMLEQDASHHHGAQQGKQPDEGDLRENLTPRVVTITRGSPTHGDVRAGNQDDEESRKLRHAAYPIISAAAQRPA